VTTDPPPLNVLSSELDAAIAGLYEEVDRAVAAAHPVCRISGRCCRFREYDHALFVTTIEARYLLEHAPAAARPVDDGETCPWQDARGRCQARAARPLACRIFHCDPSFGSAMPELMERFLARLRALASRHHMTDGYAPLHEHLTPPGCVSRLEGRSPAPGQAIAGTAPTHRGDALESR
jgi:hypothetical protein